jgi:hypothetical protein
LLTLAFLGSLDEMKNNNVSYLIFNLPESIVQQKINVSLNFHFNPLPLLNKEKHLADFQYVRQSAPHKCITAQYTLQVLNHRNHNS